MKYEQVRIASLKKRCISSGRWNFSRSLISYEINTSVVDTLDIYGSSWILKGHQNMDGKLCRARRASIPRPDDPESPALS